MTLSQFAELLQTHPDKQFHLALPDNAAVPVSFHITEVGHVAKTFIDCGGKLHTAETCQLQAWLGDDTDHRLLAGKMAAVLGLAAAKGVLPAGKELDVEIEYEGAAAALSQYPVAGYQITEDAVTLHLTTKHTDCLAKDICLPTLTMAAGADASCGCGPSGCC